MNILVLGGTGAMRKPLVDIIKSANNNVWVTTRTQRKQQGINYIVGNAKEKELYNREFNNSKLTDICGNVNFKGTYDGLEYCMRNFINNPNGLSGI